MANYCITFSPTGGVNRVADILAGALHSQWIQIDLMTETKLETTENDVCLVAVPSFGGRVADFAAQRLQGITGKAKAIRLSTMEAICQALDCQPGDILEYRP